MYHKTLSYRIFSSFNLMGVGILGCLCILPLIHIVAISFSSREAALGGFVGLWPVGFNLEAYKITLENKYFVGSLWNSFVRTSIGTLISVTLTLVAAYPLSLEDETFKGRSTYTWLFVFTTLFSGGLIPTYLVVQKLGLINSLWALVLPNAVVVFNVVLMLNFFRSVPKALREAAYIDGANHIRTLFSVYMPVSLPAVATISLFAMVSHWNSWFDGLLYMTDKTQYPMATLLQTILTNLTDDQLSKLETDELRMLSDRTVKASQILIATIPILLVYPFLQRYFVHGIKLGSVKE